MAVLGPSGPHSPCVSSTEPTSPPSRSRCLDLLPFPSHEKSEDKFLKDVGLGSGTEAARSEPATWASFHSAGTESVGSFALRGGVSMCFIIIFSIFSISTFSSGPVFVTLTVLQSESLSPF